MAFQTLFWLCVVVLIFLFWFQYNNDKTLKQILHISCRLMKDRTAGKISEHDLRVALDSLDMPGMYNKHMWCLIFFISPKVLYCPEIRSRFD